MIDKTIKPKKDINPFFSIGAKLVFIVTFIVVISLGSVYVLVLIIRSDVIEHYIYLFIAVLLFSIYQEAL